MDDLGERLRSAAVGSTAKIAWPHRLLHEAAAELARLRAEVERLQAALQPFATLAEQYEAANKRRDQHYRDERGSGCPPTADHHRVSVALGDCRKARAALAPDGKGKE